MIGRERSTSGGGGRPQLVLDIGGVIWTDLLTPFWPWMAAETGRSYDAIVALYRQEMRDSLWTGRITEESLWSWIQDVFSLRDCDARAVLLSFLQPLPARAYLSQWATSADLYVLSNHRVEWVGPVMEDIGGLLAGATISSAVGLCKPDPAVYAFVERTLPASHGPVLYVDDQERNLIPARRFGWRTLLADAEGRWIVNVDRLLAEST